LRVGLHKGVDFAQDIGVDIVIVCDVKVGNGHIGGEIVVDEPAARAATVVSL
jgi:hypothetical protein